MIALQILDVKNFMSSLLISDTFDHFLITEAGITTFNTFYIDGHLHQDYYSSEELEQMEPEKSGFSCWRDVRPFCFELIKGKHTPLGFKIVFQLSISNVEKLLSQTGVTINAGDINGLYLNLKFDSGKLSCITGTSVKIFTMDKSLEQAWDQMVQKFFRKKELAFEVL